MKGQLRDRLVEERRTTEIAATRGQGLFDPLRFRLRPSYGGPDNMRGFVCEYALAGRRLVLVALDIMLVSSGGEWPPKLAGRLPESFTDHTERRGARTRRGRATYVTEPIAVSFSGEMRLEDQRVLVFDAGRLTREERGSWEPPPPEPQPLPGKAVIKPMPRRSFVLVERAPLPIATRPDKPLPCLAIEHGVLFVHTESGAVPIADAARATLYRRTSGFGCLLLRIWDRDEDRWLESRDEARTFARCAPPKDRKMLSVLDHVR